MVLNLKWGRTRCQQKDVAAEQEQSSRDAAAGAREERGINRQGIKNGSNAQLRKGRGPLSLLGLDALLPATSRPACARLLTVQEVLEVLRGAALLLLSPDVSGDSSKFGLLGWEDNTQKQPQ